jgi:ATP-binding cassette subfamily F protein 3
MIDLSNISIQFNGRYLFRDVNYKINSGDKISLVGANGSGKTSLLRMINEELQPESGKILKKKGISIGYLPQEHVAHSGKTLMEEAKSALSDIVFLQQKEKDLTSELSRKGLSEEEHEDLIHQLGEVHYRLEELDSYSAESRIEKILSGLGFSEEDFLRLTNEFSGGWQMRIALAKILISQNDLLMMDEPTNHLDLDSLEWLIGYLKNFKGALLIVSHDKHFINKVTNKTLEIYLNQFNTFNGDYDAYLKFKKERDAQTVSLYNLQQRKIKETERFIERFRYKATKARQVQSRIKQLEKIELIELPENADEINIRFPEPPPSGRVNIELKSVSKSYGNKNIFKNMDFMVNRGEKIAFVGPNGAGKSTLAKIISGTIDFEEGNRIVGHNTSIAYYAQDVADNLNPELDIIETLEETAQDKTIGQLRNLLGSFLFSEDDVFKKIGILSGGEKSRVALAKILLTKSNFIILDEPTNHLDYSSKLVLQKALKEFTGSLILVSHDIDFLSPLINKVVEIRKGEIKIFDGDIEYYLSKREELLKDLENNKAERITDTVPSKKEKKRFEAETRQKKYEATKDLVDKIKIIEKNIEQLEQKEKELEINLSSPELYGDTENLKQLTSKFYQVKSELESSLSEWDKLSEKLQQIESKFSKL